MSRSSPIALGIDDQHRLAAQDGLADQEIEQPGLAGAGGADHQQVAFHRAEWHGEVVFARGQAMQPVCADRGGRDRGQSRGADTQQVVRKLRLIALPLEAATEPELALELLCGRGQLGDGDEGLHPSAQIGVQRAQAQGPGQPAQGHEQGQQGKEPEGARMQLPMAGTGKGKGGEQQPEHHGDGFMIGPPGVVIALHQRWTSMR